MYIRSNYDNRIHNLLIAMYRLSELNMLYDDEEITQAFDVLAEKFKEETADIEDKNGIKKIDKNITYYANGLIEYNTNIMGIANIVGKPFEYENKSKIPLPKYDVFMKTDYKYRSYWRRPDPATISNLLGYYIRAKLKNKAAPKTPKIAPLLEELEAFAKTIEIPGYDDPLQNYKFARQYVTIYDKLRSKYIEALTFITDVSSNTLDPNEYSIGRRNFYGNPFIPMTKLNDAKYIAYVTSQYGYERIDPYTHGESESMIRIPMISQKQVEKIVDLYNKIYNDNIKTRIENVNPEKHETLKELCEYAENDTKESIEKYYTSIVKHLDSELLANDPTYQDWGYAAMIVERNYASGSKTFGYERILINHDNNHIETKNVVRDRTRLFVTTYDYKTKETIYETDIDPDFYNKHKAEYNAYIDGIKKSVEFMILCLNDIIHTLSKIDNNPDFVKWMIKRKIIPECEILTSGIEDDDNTVTSDIKTDTENIIIVDAS